MTEAKVKLPSVQWRVLKLVAAGILSGRGILKPEAADAFDMLLAKGLIEQRAFLTPAGREALSQEGEG